MKNWDQEGDFEGIITETLMHFNYSDPEELEMARKFRDADLPFKLTDVPEITTANHKWTDEYILKHGYGDRAKGWRGFVTESYNQYLPKYTETKWNLETLGLPPGRWNDWTYPKWSQHADYADAVGLSYDQPHFQMQDFHIPENSFMKQDLPSFSSRTETFMYFNTSIYEGLKCRFSERGTVIPLHFDIAGRNMLGMIAGAKRYIMFPPTECSKLGTESNNVTAMPRGSWLNYGHFKYLNTENKENPMSKEERAWLEKASQARAVETVVKAGEVIFMVSFKFVVHGE